MDHHGVIVGVGQIDKDILHIGGGEFDLLESRHHRNLYQYLSRSVRNIIENFNCMKHDGANIILLTSFVCCLPVTMMFLELTTINCRSLLP